MYDIPLTNAEILLKAATAMLELKPLLEPKNLEKAIQGLEGAKETLKKKSEIDNKLQQAIDLEEANNNLLAQITEDQKALEVANSALAAREKAVKDSEVIITKDMERNEKERAAIEKLQIDLDRCIAIIKKKEETIDADLEAAAEAKKKAQEILTEILIERFFEKCE